MKAEPEIERNEQEQTDSADARSEAPDAPKKIKRVRLLSPRKGLQQTLLRMEKLSSQQMKPEKAVDLLIQMSEIQRLLLKMTLDAERAALEEENKNLKAKIEELTAVTKSKSDVRDFLAQLKAGPRTPALDLDFTSVVEKIRQQTTRSAAPEPTNPEATNPEATNPVRHAPSLRAASEATPPKQVIPASRSAIQEELEERERQENVERQRVMDLQWKSQMGLMPPTIAARHSLSSDGQPVSIRRNNEHM